MNLKKIFDLIISDFIKNSHNRHSIRLGYYNDRIMVIDQYRLFIIDAEQFPFNMAICGDLVSDKIIPNKKDYEIANYTNKLVSVDKKTCAIIESPSGTAWVDIKLLKEYGDNITYMTCITHPERNAVLIYQGDIFLGEIMPIKQSNNIE